MPKAATTDYKDAVVYRIVCRDLSITDTYVGSTTDLTKKRLAHKKMCIAGDAPLYVFIREHGGWANWDCVLVESFPCANNEQLRQRERFHLEQLKATLNVRTEAPPKAATPKAAPAKRPYERKLDGELKLCECGAYLKSLLSGPHCRGKQHTAWATARRTSILAALAKPAPTPHRMPAPPPPLVVDVPAPVAAPVPVSAPFDLQVNAADILAYSI